MILADTSVWLGYFRGHVTRFRQKLAQKQILIHPAVLGELAVGNLRERSLTLLMLRSLPRVKSGTTDECLDLIERHRFYGRGIGWIDIQLLVAARLSHAQLWSLDRELTEAATQLRVAYLPG